MCVCVCCAWMFVCVSSWVCVCVCVCRYMHVHIYCYTQADGALETALTYKVIEDSGTTVATVLLKGDLFLAAGLGDSRVVLGLL